MLYHLFQYLESFDFPGAGVFQYITFRSACAIILSLIIATVVGKRVIRMLQRQQIGEEIRDLGLQGQMEKKGTPTMGGMPSSKTESALRNPGRDRNSGMARLPASRVPAVSTL